ncbi:MAG TPA: OstA-like protein, partial [Flavisolibacter sp.]|nr:OstA-like protein [Flavisolibacter sp.]
MNRYFIYLLIFICTSLELRAQIPPADNPDIVEILPGTRKLEFRKVDDGTEVQILAGNVRLRQGTTLFTADSCVINSGANTFEAFGNVHINDSDTAKIWSNQLRYLTDQKKAYLTGNVRLTDGRATLTTNALEYDVNTNIGVYRNGGRIVNKKTTVTSREGIYYADVRDIRFINKVELRDPGYTLTSDSLLYNSETQVATFIAYTFIKDSSGRTIRTREGYYDLQGGRSEFTQRTTIQDKAVTVSGDRIASDDQSGIIQIEGRGVMVDTARGTSLLANRIFINKKTDALLATQKPLMIIKQKRDSIFIAADTLFSARLSDLYKDTSAKKNSPKTTTKGKPDSTDRFLEAYRNVRVFSDSLQSVSDSLFYSFKDSIFQLYQNPVVWSNKSQITGDTILLFTKNQKADKLKVINNSFLVSEVEQGVYNQIKSTRMDGHFKEGVIDSVVAKGTAESVYFLQDRDSAYTSINQTQ